MERMGSLLKTIAFICFFVGLGVFLKWTQTKDIVADNGANEAAMTAENRSLVGVAEEDTFQINGVELNYDEEQLEPEEIVVITEFVTLELLGYGGEEYLNEIGIRNDAIFTRDSADKEEYANRMERFVEANSEGRLYTKGKAVGTIDTIVRSEDCLTVHININHELTYIYSDSEALNHCVDASGYMLEIVNEDGGYKIYTCQEDAWIK